jgi:hypothetical protein
VKIKLTATFLEALSKLVVTLDTHPRGAALLVAVILSVGLAGVMCAQSAVCYGAAAMV